MAELVTWKLEERTAEISALQKFGLFDEDEIRKIMAKRKEKEYRLRRRIKEKDHYLDYIQYEMTVLKLLKFRRKEEHFFDAKAEIEGSIVNRIKSLFSTVCRQYPTDARLWLTRIHYVETKLQERAYASRLYGKMLQIITNRPNLWVMAVRFEFEKMNSVDSARTLIQKGLSFNKKSKLLWQEFFRLELLFVDVFKREEQLRYYHDSLVSQRCYESIPMVTTGLRYMANRIKKMRDADFIEKPDVASGMVAATVYKHARRVFSDDIEFALSFVTIVKDFTWAWHIEQMIFDELCEGFPDSVRVLEVKTERMLDNVTDLNEEAVWENDTVLEVEKILCDVVKVTGSVEAWSVYLTANMRITSWAVNEENVRKLLDKLESAFKENKLSEYWALTWIHILVDQSMYDEALTLYDTLTSASDQSTQFRKSATVWHSYICYIANKLQDIQMCVKLFHKARTLVNEREGVLLWTTILDICIAGNAARECIKDIFELGIVMHSVIAIPVKEKYIRWAYLSTNNMAKVRNLYKRLCQILPNSVEFHQLYVDIEKSQVEPVLRKLRRAYARILEDFGSTQVDSWLASIQLERESGDVGKASVLYSQAIQTLDGSLTQKFIRRHTLQISENRHSAEPDIQTDK